MKVRWWPFDPSSHVASTRIRCLNVVSGLRQKGVDAALWVPGDKPPSVLVLSKRYDPETIAACSDMRLAGTRVVLDLCDNHLHVDLASDAASRRTAWLRQAIESVDAVTVSTPALAEEIREACKILVPLHVIGDAFEEPLDPPRNWSRARAYDELKLARLRVRLATHSRRPATRLLWFGNHGTAHAAGGMLDLLQVMPALNEVATERAISLTVVSNSWRKFETVRAQARFPMLYLDWSQSTFSRAARLHDVALLPVQDNAFTRCKTNNRLATALLHGLAVIADPIPSYRDFAASVCLGDWPASLRRMCSDPAARHAMTQTGVAQLRRDWNPELISEAWRQTLLKIDGRPTRP